MDKTKRSIIFGIFCVAVLFAGSAQTATSKIGILVFDGSLTSDVTAPVEVFGAATKKAWFSSYEVVIDDGIITSNGGPISYQAAFELLAKLSSKKFADERANS